MQRVEITVFGKQAMVDQDMVKKMLKKQALVSEASELQSMLKTEKSTTVQMYLEMKIRKVSASIINLNRTIRRTVQFI
jgi:hypothetical protein